MLAGQYGGAAEGWRYNGEPCEFWVDLSKAGLIDNSFTTADSNNCNTSNPSLLFPKAKIANNSYVYTFNAYSVGEGRTLGSFYTSHNFFTISALTSAPGYPVGTTGISVIAAYNIDKKIDDGFPLQGRIQTLGGGINNITDANNFNSFYGAEPQWIQGGIPWWNIAPSSTTCFDTNGASPGPITDIHYSLSQNNGAGLNCMLSFQFH